MNPVWANQIEIGVEFTPGTGGAAGTWTYATLCKGIEGMTFNSGEQNQQYFFLCGNGYAHNETTGSAPSIQITGRRVVGDAAQDYIASKQFSLGTDRNTSVKITAEGQVITCDCTIGDVVSFGGNTLDVNNFSCTLYFNGQPTVTAVTP
jgi:hypothetical protein